MLSWYYNFSALLKQVGKAQMFCKSSKVRYWNQAVAKESVVQMMM